MVDVLVVSINESIDESGWFQVSNLGFEKDKSYYAYRIDEGVLIALDGYTTAILKDGEFDIVETTEELRISLNKFGIKI